MKIAPLVLSIEKRFLKAKLYYGHGTDNARDEAVALVFHVLNLPFDIDDSTLNRVRIDTRHLQKIDSLVTRRIREHKPLPYLTHTAYFSKLPFYVDERVIIPRSPFAELIEKQFQPWINPRHVRRILDLCTGCGCMAIACAKAFPQAKIDAVDLSADALTVSRINIKKHRVQTRVRLFQSDLYDQLPKTTYDLIISNPPYVSSNEMRQLPREYHHEPKMALAAKDQGLELVIRILKDASRFLSPQGTLWVEVGNAESALKRRFPHMPFIWLEFERGGGGLFFLDA